MLTTSPHFLFRKVSISELDIVISKTHILPDSQTVDMFGCRVFINAIKTLKIQSSSVISSALNSMNCSILKEESTQKNTPGEDEGRGWSDEATGQGMLRISRSKCWKKLEDFPLTDSRRTVILIIPWLWTCSFQCSGIMYFSCKTPCLWYTVMTALHN